MMQEEKRKQLEQKIQFYITHEEKLYKDWYSQITLSHIQQGGRREDVGWVYDTLESARARFKKWCQEQLSTIREVCLRNIPGTETNICKVWGELQVSIMGGFIGTIVEFLLRVQEITLPFPITPEVFIIGLVLNGCLDMLCEEKVFDS